MPTRMSLAALRLKTGRPRPLSLELPDLVLLDVLLGACPAGRNVCFRMPAFSDVARVMLTSNATN